MPRAMKGVLITCDPSIKAIILKYDAERHDYVVDELDDDHHLLVREHTLSSLQERLTRELDSKMMQPDESESEG